MKFMRYPTLLLFISLFTCDLLAASALSWDRTEVDLEMKPGQEEVRASFTVTNEGDERIRIARVKTSCGCTGSIIDRKILEPGKSTEIIATFNKGKRQGLNRNKLDVFIDSQAEPVATLRMNVQIPQLIEATPRIVYWNKSSSKSERRVAITLDERYLDTIRRVEYDRDKLVIIEEKDPGGKASLLLRIAPKSYNSQYRGTVKVLASGKDGRKAEARIHAFVQP